ncbi:MAG: DUF177 domain-containing protein [Clostridia bacterium]|nr:DUF177 domain-containing protein [Clostridia bacterium]
MILDLSDIIKNDKDVMSVDCDIDLSSLEFMGEDFTFSKPLHIVGVVRNNTKNLELDAEVSGSMQVRCARCAKPFSTEVRFDVSEILIREDGEISPDSDVVIFSGHEVDLTEIVTNNFFMNVSGRYLCKEDCKGLCSVCGIDLNEGTCSCDSDTIDPRWAALAEIIKDTTTE